MRYLFLLLYLNGDIASSLIIIFFFKKKKTIYFIFSLYLMNSPVVRAEPLRFREDGVAAVVRDVLLPWFNAYRFFVENCTENVSRMKNGVK